MEREQINNKPNTNMNDHMIDEMNNFNGFLKDCEIEQVFHKIK